MNPLERLRRWLEDKPLRADVAAILILTALWALYFWRVLTLNSANQVSLPEGDFSGQFLAFGAYQARRLLSGEIPLWNPYNYGGHPFLADTQSAVFYPPRLLTIAITYLFFGGWSYAGLQAEVIAHVWLASIFMYGLVQTITRSRIAGVISGIVLAYGGYLTGYPTLQLAVLEAGVWLPLSLMGIHRASGGTNQNQWILRWLVLSAFAVGMSLLAGHPQTSLYITYILIAFTLYRAVLKKFSLLQAGIALAVVCGLGYGFAGIQLLPGLEYARFTTRAKLGFDSLGGGFPFADLIGFLLPRILSHWSPLYIGIAPLTLGILAIARREVSSRFWAVTGGIALLISFGGASVVYNAAYLAIPGFSLFRGQERAAFIVAHAGAILAGIGTASLLRSPDRHATTSRILQRLFSASWGFAALVLLFDRIFPGRGLYDLLVGVVLLAVFLTITWLLIGSQSTSARRPWWAVALIALVFFDLFSVTMGTDWEPIPASDRHLLSSLVPVAQADQGLYRVDGRLGLGQNYGTLIGMQDVRGVSPLILTTQDAFLRLPANRLYQLLSVKYVFTDWRELEVPSKILAESSTAQGVPLFLHEIIAPSPRAWIVYSAMVTSDVGQALGWLTDPGFDPRQVVILQTPPRIDLPAIPPLIDEVSIDSYAPEEIHLHASSPNNGILVLSELDYPGWKAFVDSSPTEILRANNGLRSVLLTAGEHDILFIYQPISVRLGMAVSLTSLLILLLLGVRSQRIRFQPQASNP